MVDIPAPQTRTDSGSAKGAGWRVRVARKLLALDSSDCVCACHLSAREQEREAALDRQTVRDAGSDLPPPGREVLVRKEI